MNPNPICMCGHNQWYHGATGCRASESRGPVRDNNDYDEDCACKLNPETVLRKAIERDIEFHKCSEHRRYQAKRKPRAACEGCWRLWLRINP